MVLKSKDNKNPDEFQDKELPQEKVPGLLQ
jgi:hypothetical protein